MSTSNPSVVGAPSDGENINQSAARSDLLPNVTPKEQIAAAMSSNSNTIDLAAISADTIMPIHSLAMIWDTTEHKALGDDLYLKVPNTSGGTGSHGTWFTGDSKNKFDASQWGTHYNKQCLSFGQINALAGDFYATSQPISGDVGESLSDPEMATRFMAAFDFMFKDPASAAESQSILAADRTIEDKPYKEWLQKAKELGKEPSWIFATKMEGAKEQTEEFDRLTEARASNGGTYPKYSDILLNNFDHFGDDAIKAYTVGHKIALEEAANAKKNSDPTSLMRAYAIDAFADHFLEDAFSAGHIRTPRRALHSTNPFYDLCANLMHNEDGALGVKVHNKDKPNQTWRCFGDSFLHDDDPGAKKTKNTCRLALQASADEVWKAYDTGTYSQNPADYRALQLVPIPVNDHDSEYCAPLFFVDGEGYLWQRNWGPFDASRRNWDKSNYVWIWTAATTYAEAITSGWWKYKMTLDSKGTDE